MGPSPTPQPQALITQPTEIPELQAKPRETGACRVGSGVAWPACPALRRRGQGPSRGPEQDLSLAPPAGPLPARPGVLPGGGGAGAACLSPSPLPPGFCCSPAWWLCCCWRQAQLGPTRYVWAPHPAAPWGWKGTSGCDRRACGHWGPQQGLWDKS